MFLDPAADVGDELRVDLAWPLVLGQGAGAFTGDAPYYLIAEMHFPDKDTFKQAMGSEENRAAGKDVMEFAGRLVSMVHGEFNEA